MSRRSGDDRILNVLAGLLLVANLVIASITLTVLGLSVTFGSTGFGGDTTVTAADRAREARAQLSGVLVVVLAAAAIPLFVRLRERADLRAFVLAGFAIIQLAGFLLLVSGTG